MKAHEDGNRKARIVRAIADFEQRWPGTGQRRSPIQARQP